MRWIGAAFVLVLLVVGFAAYMQPNLFPTGDIDLTQLIYLVLALLLVSGGLFGFGRVQADGAKILPSILFWGALILAIVAIYPLFN
ncbi:MAG: hypothetical protein AB7P07_03565 [Hyphomonadaceae bacterium]